MEGSNAPMAFLVLLKMLPCYKCTHMHMRIIFALIAQTFSGNHLS